MFALERLSHRPTSFGVDKTDGTSSYSVFSAAAVVVHLLALLRIPRSRCTKSHLRSGGYDTKGTT